MSRSLIAAGLALALVSCHSASQDVVDIVHDKPLGLAVTVGTGLVALDIFSVVNSQKTLDDQVISLVSGKDCSTLRASHGGAYCEVRPDVRPLPTVAQATYCYKSIGSVSCYGEPVERDTAQLYGVRVVQVPDPRYVAPYVPPPAP